MLQFTFIFVIVITIFLSRASSLEDDITELPLTSASTENDSKILVDPDTNAINIVKPPRVKPTTSQVEFEPGVPPGWTTHPSQPTRPSRPTRPTRPTRPSRPPRPAKPNRPTKTTRLPFGPAKLTSESEPLSNHSTFDDNLSRPAVTEISVETNTLIIEGGTSSTYPPGVSPPEPIIGEPDRGVVDWLLGLVGIRPSTDNPQNPGSSGPLKTCNIKCRCGLTYKHNRIVGGVETQVNEYPWMVYLLYNNRFYCGGSLINNLYILTAGHCVNGFSKERLSVVFLDHDRSTTSDTKTFTKRVGAVLRHNLYGIGGSYNNDIALLRLESEVPLTGILKPVCLPATGKSFTGYIGIATGWGATQAHGQVSNKLREVRVPILSNTDCRKTGYRERITDNMLCAGLTQGSKDSCQGDSGGPLHVENGTYHTIVGITSWGEGCAEPNYPGVYARVNRYISWINGNTKDACYC